MVTAKASGDSGHRPAEAIPVEQTSCVVCNSRVSDSIASGRDYLHQTSRQVFTFARCGDCDHVYLDPRPVVEAAHRIYPSDYYTLTAEHVKSTFTLLGRIKDVVVYRRVSGVVSELAEGSRVLEVGAGDGALLLAIARKRSDLHLTALDLSFVPSRRALLESHGIEVIEALVEEADLPGGYNLVIMNQLIEHLWDVEAGLNKIRDKMQPGGLLSVCTPNLDGYDYGWFRHGSWGGYHFPRHLNLFSQASLSRLLERLGFEVDRHHDLPAPLIWTETATSICERRGWIGAGFFRRTNVLTLSVFTLLDLVMKTLGRHTSNQQVVARRGP